MQLSSTLILAGVVAASTPQMERGKLAAMEFKRLVDRQITIPCDLVPAPATCEKSCGPGFVTCVEFPYCYNPGDGETCCSDGSVCSEGYYCTDGGCCPDGSTLDECDATKTLSVLPPPSSTTAEPSHATTELPEPTPTVETTSSEAETTTAEPTAVEPTTEAPPSNGTITSGAPTLPSASEPPTVTAGAVKNTCVGLLAAAGGLGALVLGL